jgi:rRNA maturation endonuclease Nob1
MKNINWVEVCVHCNEINISDQPIYCRCNHSQCPLCGKNEWILINADEELKDIEGFNYQLP